MLPRRLPNSIIYLFIYIFTLSSRSRLLRFKKYYFITVYRSNTSHKASPFICLFSQGFIVEWLNILCLFSSGAPGVMHFAKLIILMLDNQINHFSLTFFSQKVCVPLSVNDFVTCQLLHPFAC